MVFKLPNFKVDQPKSAFATGHARWTNKDLDPIPRHLRKWGVWSIIAYWISDAFNAATCEFASSVIGMLPPVLILIYHYWHCVNWRAILAFVVGIAPSLPGFINSINNNVKVGVGVHPYQFGWLLSFAGASIVYLGSNWIFPAREALIERAVLPDEIYDEQVYLNGVESTAQVNDFSDGGSGEGEKKGWKAVGKVAQYAQCASNLQALCMLAMFA